jgi:FixJ family two-component response regulator
MTQPLIHIVDDDASFRTAIGRLLQTSGYRVVQFESGSKYLEILPPPEEPCCILLDLKMAGMDGLGLQDRLAELGSVSPVVFLTGHGDIATSVQALKGGAENFLTKPVPKATLLEAVNAAMARFEQQRAQRDKLRSLQQLVSRLTAREREVFSQVIRGRLNKQIAHALKTSERTIKAHRHSIMQKLEVHSVAEAVTIAERLGLLASPDNDRPST